MASNQASMARRQRERARVQQAQEKMAKRKERREQKKTASSPRVDNPLEDPSIDWSGAVRETKITLPEELVELEEAGGGEAGVSRDS